MSARNSVEEISQISSHRRRQTSGINRHLDNDYLWPPAFGKGRPDINNITENNSEDKENRLQQDNAMNEKENESTTPVNQSVNSSAKTNKSASTSKYSSKSRYSNISVDLQKKRLALETEKARQAIIEEEMRNKLKLLEMERQVREAEIIENAERESSRGSSFYPDVRVVESPNNTLSTHYSPARTSIIEWVNNIPDNIENFPNGITEEINDDDNQQAQQKSDIQILCESLGAVLKSATSDNKSEKICARRNMMEKDFPFFDGKSEEWPSFIYQFKRISSMCDYSPEECMIKLQKCLKGEAKFAVSGMMMSPQNLNTVLKTLEMRFGRPDQIIEVVLSRVRAIPSVRDHDMEGIIQFSNHVACLVSTIKSLNYDAHLQNPQVLKELCQKLPSTSKLRWGEVIMTKNASLVNLNDFSEWLSEIASAACYVSTPKISPKTYHNFSSQKYEKSYVTSSNTSDTLFCSHCSRRGHSIETCEHFKALDIDTRWTEITKRKLCFSCLRKNHQTNKCRSRKNCGMNGCKLPHNKLLHKDIFKPNRQNEENVATTSTENSQENVLTVENKENNVLLRMVNVILYGPDKSSIRTVALLDEASTVTLLDSSVAELLNLDGLHQPLCIQWTNDVNRRHEDSLCLDMDISGDFENAKKFSMKNVRTIKNLNLPLQKIHSRNWRDYSYLKGIPIHDITERPMLLIGQDNIRLSIARKIVQGPEHLPIATKTNLGWTLHGVNDYPSAAFNRLLREKDEQKRRAEQRSFRRSYSSRSRSYSRLPPVRRRSRSPMIIRRSRSRSRSFSLSRSRHRDRDYDDDSDSNGDERLYKDVRRNRDNRDRRSRDRDRDSYYNDFDKRRGPPPIQQQWGQQAMSPRPIQESYYPPTALQQGYQTNRFEQDSPRDSGLPFTNREFPLEPEKRESPKKEEKERIPSDKRMDKKESDKSSDRKRKHGKRSRTPDEARNPIPKRQSKFRNRESVEKHKRQRRDSSDKEEKRRDHSDDERSKEDKKKHKDKKDSEKKKNRDKKEKHKDDKEKKTKEKFKQIIPKIMDAGENDDVNKNLVSKKKREEEEPELEGKRLDTLEQEETVDALSEEQELNSKEKIQDMKNIREKEDKPKILEENERKKSIEGKEYTPEPEEPKPDLYGEISTEDMDTAVMGSYGRIKNEISFEEEEDRPSHHESEEMTEEGEIKEFDDEEKDVLELHTTDIKTKKWNISKTCI